MNRRRLLLGWVLAGVVALGAFTYGVVDEGDPLTSADRTLRLSQEFACPQCSGQSVAESDVPVARAIRSRIRELVDAGASDDEIADQLIAAYGQDVSYTPSGSGVTALVWVLPVLVAAAGVGGLGYAFLRWRRLAAPTATAADRELVERHRGLP